MKRSLEAFLLNQLGAPWQARLLDLPKTALVLHRLEYQNKVYRGFHDYFVIQHDGKSVKANMEMLGRPGETVTAPGSVIREWSQKRLVSLPGGRSYEAGRWDVYFLEGKGRGYRPWDSDEKAPYNPGPPPSEFDDLWVPIRRLRRKGPFQREWSEIYYLPWRLTQGAALMGASGAGDVVIDLEKNLAVMHRNMVTAAY